MDSMLAILLLQSLEHFICPAVKLAYPFLSRQLDGGGCLFKLLIQPSSSYYKKAGLSIPQRVRGKRAKTEGSLRYIFLWLLRIGALAFPLLA